MDDIKKDVVRLVKSAKPDKTDKNNTSVSISGDVGNGNVIVGGNINIGGKKIIKTQLQYDENKYISPKQAKEISDLIKKLVVQEEAVGKSRSKAYAIWWGRLKNHFKVTTYKEIPNNKFNYAVKWLKQQIAINREKLKMGDRKEWKKDLYKAIYAKCNEIGWSKADLYIYIESKFGKNITSLKQLNSYDLEHLYDIMKIKKRK